MCMPVFQVLADKNRQEILLFLSNKEKGLSVKHIFERMKLSRPAVSHHLKVLRGAGLVGMKEEGTENLYFS